MKKSQPPKYKPACGVIIACKDEADQKRTFERLQKQKYKLRVVNV